MRWLLHGQLTPAVGEALVRHGHEVRDCASLGLAPGAGVEEVLRVARTAQLDILTADGALVAGVYDLDFWCTRCIVYLQLAGQDVEQDDAIDRLFQRYKRLTPGRLYTVTETRVKVRQLPGRGSK